MTTAIRKARARRSFDGLLASYIRELATSGEPGPSRPSRPPRRRTTRRFGDVDGARAADAQASS
jgi:hypothetical protein